MLEKGREACADCVRAGGGLLRVGKGKPWEGGGEGEGEEGGGSCCLGLLEGGKVCKGGGGLCGGGGFEGDGEGVELDV